MRNSQYLFMIFVLGLTIVFLQADRAFRAHFGDSKSIVGVLKNLEVQLESEKLKTALALNELQEYQYKNGEVSRAPASREGVETSRFQLAKAKEQFKQREWHLAIESLKQLIEQFPASPYILESHFLLAESYFMAGQHEPCLDMIYVMMEQFPENEMTGFIMLRLGQIFSSRKKFVEAHEVFLAVQDQFPQSKTLVNQAHVLATKIQTVIEEDEGN